MAAALAWVGCSSNAGSSQANTPGDDGGGAVQPGTGSPGGSSSGTSSSSGSGGPKGSASSSGGGSSGTPITTPQAGSSSSGGPNGTTGTTPAGSSSGGSSGTSPGSGTTGTTGTKGATDAGASGTTGVSRGDASTGGSGGLAVDSGAGTKASADAATTATDAGDVPSPNATGPFPVPSDPCAPRNGYRNLFFDLLSKSAADVDAKLQAGFQSLFHGDASTAAVFVPVGTDQAYIWDVNDNDIRSEGMSYGMMIAVQLNKQTEFNMLWEYALKHMLITSGAQAGYFMWELSPSGSVLGATSAPDGEEYIATALIFASREWGDGTGDFAYSQQAQKILNALATEGDFSTGNSEVTFGVGTNITDPSYFLPAFYQVWACFDTKNQAFWKSVLSTARPFFHKAVNATTGLAPGQANFDGSATGQNFFNSDAWRVVGNIMMDYNFYAADSWQTSFASTYATFFTKAWAQAPFPDMFNLDGTVRHTNPDPALGIVSENALVAFGVPTAQGMPYVEALWQAQPPTGQFRYFDGMLYMLSTLHVGGRFQLWK